MTSYEFEVMAKAAVVEELLTKYDIDTDATQLDLVWFAHELGHKKCTIWGKPMGNLYAEVTYNRDAKEIYVDVYRKMTNTAYPIEWFDVEVSLA